jgi:integrase
MSIQEHEDGYYVEAYLGKDPLTNEQIRKYKLFSPKNRKSLKQAKTWEIEILNDYKNGELDLNGDMKLSKYLEYWFETYVETNCAYQTQKRYRTLCNCIESHIGYLPLEKVKVPVIERFYADLKKETITLKDGTKKRRYKDGTILKTHKVLKQALNKAVAWDMIAKNPAAYVKPPEDDKREINTWSIEEAEAFLEKIKDSKLYLPVFIAFHTGLREGEICALRWSDINLKEGYLKVNHNMVQEGKKLVLEDPKTDASKDTVAMTKELTEKLKEVQKAQEKMSDTNKGENVISFKKENTFDYVCSWDDGRPLRPLYVTKTFTKYVKRYGFKKITFHGLRHSHATILFANGASSHEISKRLRHSRVSTTDDIYIHVNQEIKKSTADIFSKAVDQVK